jgi:hypothetical protein
VIPAGITVTSNGPVILFLGPVISITIGGTLTLNNGSLQIDASDVVTILSGGKINGTGLLGGTVYSGVTPIFIANGSSIDGPKTITNGVLPIKLIYFKSEAVGEGIQLEWASAEERNFGYYDIERSEDGRLFTSIATIIGKDNDGSEYTFVDPSPIEGANYYRLTAVDLDGSREEMQMIKCEWNRQHNWITVFPNPVSGGMIHALFSDARSGSFRLLDCNGMLIAESFFANVFGCNLQLPATTGPGIYFVHLQSEGRNAQMKVIVR